MKRLADELEDGAWAGKACLVLGGGLSLLPSLARYLFRARGFRAIAVNRSYRLLAGLHADQPLVFSMDAGFWKKADCEFDGVRWRVAGAGCPLVHLRVFNQKMPSGPTHYVDAIGDDHRAPAWGTSLATGIGSGWHSGFGAVNLADVLGADPIYLLGFDYSGGWWHEGYEHGPRPDDVQARFVQAFEAVRDQVRARVVNCNPESLLRCFEFGSLP